LNVSSRARNFAAFSDDTDRSMSESKRQSDVGAIAAGHAIYSPVALRIYDAFVLGFSNHLLWRCPTRHLREVYDRNLSAVHLDIGVGTGYFLDKAHWSVATPAITLLDLNEHCLRHAGRRIGRFRPRILRANVLEPLPVDGPFDSVALCYLLHCLPGNMVQKSVVFDHIRACLAPGARVFGATIVQGRAPRSAAAQAMMDFYNRKGVFSNVGDTIEDLEGALRKRFSQIAIRLIGCVAVFEARARVQ
jgi:ubiquinone/menaquinone biosynthesis C-methylase UbiE